MPAFTSFTVAELRVFADFDLSDLVSEKFLVAVGATTGSLAALAIVVAFWLVKRVVDGEAGAAKIALVRTFMWFCGTTLVVSGLATVALAINNRGKTVAAETKAIAATDRAQEVTAEKQSLLVDVSALRKTVSDTDAARQQLFAALQSVRAEPSVTPFVKSKLDREVAVISAATPAGAAKATAQLDQLLQRHALSSGIPGAALAPAAPASKP